MLNFMKALDAVSFTTFIASLAGVPIALIWGSSFWAQIAGSVTIASLAAGLYTYAWRESVKKKK